jgi:ribosomal protein S24E
MDLSIKGKKDNPSLGRTELSCELSFDKAMPSRKQIREAVCAAAGVAPELLVIVSAEGGYGTNRASVLAHAYKSKEALAVERRHLLVRDGLAEKEKKAAKAASPPKK